MIKFCGIMTEDNKKFIIKKEKLIFFLASIIPILIGIALTTTAAIKINLIWLTFFIPLIFFLCIPLFPIGKKTMDLMIPTKISINNNSVICEGNNFKCSRNLLDIKKVIDYGNFYQIYFKWPKKSYKFLCQKDLLVEGSLEDFEKMFPNKIIKKINL